MKLVVNLINILRAAFAQIFFCQKITKPNYNWRKAARSNFIGKKAARKKFVKLTPKPQKVHHNV